MRTLCCFTLLLLTVRATKEDFHTEQIKGTTVTKDWLLKKENTIGHDTETIPKENTLRHIALAVAAKFPAAILSDTRPVPPYESTNITKALAVISQSGEHFVSRDGQNSLTSTRDNPSVMRIHTGSEIPLISNYEKIVLSPTQAAFESMVNGTSEPGVHLSADGVKASLWLHNLLDNRNQRNTDSITVTSADGGPGVPILPAPHPYVIDNLAVQRNDNDDKQSQGKDEKGISNLERNEYLLNTLPSIFKNNTAEDSVRGNITTNVCLTCLKYRGEVSTEKSVALPPLSPDGFSDPLSTDSLPLDFNQFPTSLQSLQQQSIGQREKILIKDKSHQNLTMQSSVSMREKIVYHQTFPPSFSKTVNHGQSTLINSQIRSFFPDMGTVQFDTQSHAEISSESQKDTKKQSGHTYSRESFVAERPISTTAVLYRSSKSLYTVRKPVKSGDQEMFGKEVSIRDTQSKAIYFSKNNNDASHRPTVSNTPIIVKASHSSQKSVLPEGSDHSTASNPTTKMSLIEAHSAITPSRLSRPNTSTVKNPESHSLTGGADSLNSVLSGQMPVKPSSHKKESIMTLLPGDSAIKFATITTVRQLTDKRDPQTLSTINSIIKHASVHPSGTMNKPFMEKTHAPTFTTKKVVVPVKLFLSGARQDFDNNVSMFTTLSTKLISENLTMNRLLGSQSKIAFDVGNDNHVAPTPYSFVKYNRDLIRESLIVHNLKLGDKNEQMVTVVAKDEDKEMKDIQKLQQKQETRNDEKFGNRGDELLRSDKTESSKQEKIITTVIATNQNAGREEDKMKQHEAKTSRDGGRKDEDLRQMEIINKEDTKRKGMTETNTESKDGENTTKDEKSIAGKQRVPLTEEEEGAGRKVTVNTEVIKQTTYVPFGSTTNSKELNRDKGHTITNLSSSHSLIKQLGATEHTGIHLDEKNAEIVEMKNMPFPYKVTSNHRQQHPILRSESPEVSKMTSLLKESHTQIKPHSSSHRAMLTMREATASLTKETTQNKVVEATFSVTVIPKMDPKPFKVSTSKFHGTLKPIAPHQSETTSAHSELKIIRNKLSVTTPQLAITSGLLSTQPRFTVNSSTLNVSIIYSISDHRHKFSNSVLEANSLLQTMDKGERVKHIIPAHVFESGVKDRLTSNMIEEVNISTSVNPAPSQRMYNDSSTKPPTAGLSSEAHMSNGQQQPHQEQSAPEISQSSSSFDMTSGQPCSFKLSEKPAHSDALHAHAADNEQRSVQTLMASMSPKAKNNQFPLSSMSPLLNLVLFGGDSLPGNYSPTRLTRSTSEKEILSANSNTVYANSGRGHAESLLGTVDETNQIEENDSVQTMVTFAVKHSDAITKQMAESRNENNSFPFIAQTIGRSKNHDNKPDKFSSVSLVETEKPVVKNNNENIQTDLSNSAVKTTLQNIHNLSQLEGDKETNAITFAFETTHKIVQASNEHVVPVKNYFATPVLDANDQAGTRAFVESDSQPKIPIIQTNDVTNNAIYDMEHHSEKAPEKQHDPSTPRSSVSILPIGSDLKVPNISTQQISDWILNITFPFQMTTTITNDYLSLVPTASISGLRVSTEAHESAVTMTENVDAVIEKSSQAAHAEHMVRSSSHTEALSLREPLSAPTIGKLTPAVKRKNTTETQSVEQPEHEISGQVIEQSQHAPPGMIAIIRPINDSELGIQASALKATHIAGGAHETTPTVVKRVGCVSFKYIKTALTTKSAFEANYVLSKRTFAAHTLDREDKHKKHTLPEKTSISQVILGAVIKAVPPTGISPPEIGKTSCGTIGCATSDRTTKTTIGTGETDHTTQEQIYKTKAGSWGDHFNAVQTPDTKPQNGDCGTDCPVPGNTTPQATNLDSTALSPVTSKSDHATADETLTKKAKSMMNGPATKTRRLRVETDHLARRGTPEQAQFVGKKTQRNSYRETSDAAQEAIATEVTLSEPEATTVQTTEKTTEYTLFTEKNTKTQLNRAKAEIFEAQNANRSAHTMAVQESGHRLLLLEQKSESELLRLQHRKRASSHLYLSGVTEVSEDLCGSGNYTAEMSLNLGRGVEPGDAVPALGNLRVVINLKTNNSRINLEVTSCCLSPTIQPDLTSSTCCLFSRYKESLDNSWVRTYCRLATEPAGITLLPSALSTSASFTISLFQMINYSVVYLHCDLSVCLRNHSDCERQCLQQRSAFPLEGPEAIVTNLRNRISFGPMLKEVPNSTFPKEIDPSELDLFLVIVSLVVGSSLITVTLLLVWLAYRRQAIWLLHSAAPPRACCGCLCRRDDLILP